MKGSNSGSVQIGWASRDVTPERKVNLRGQFHMRISKGVNDPLTVTALALSVNGSEADSVIFVSCDTCGLPQETIDKCRKKVSSKTSLIDVNRIIMNATHTHTAPGFASGSYPPCPPGVMTPEEYSELFVERAADAVAEAWKNRHPGGISWGLGTAVVGHNRRATYFTEIAPLNERVKGLITDGYTRMYGDTNDPKFSHIEGYEDHYVNLLYTWDKEKRFTGVVVNLVCPSQETEQDYYVSADFWHEIRTEIKKRNGKHVFVLPQCSAAGDQSPHLLWYKEAEQRMLKLRAATMREEIGRRVANAVDDVLPLARQDIRSVVSIKHAVKIIELPQRMITEEEAATVRSDLAKLESEVPAEKKDVHYVSMRRCRHALERYERQKSQPNYPMELHAVRLGDVAFSTNSFELFMDYGTRIKARSPAVQTFLIQLAGSGTYLPTARAVAGKGYGGGVYDNEVGPEGGQKLVEETVKLIKELWTEESR